MNRLELTFSSTAEFAVGALLIVALILAAVA
jgi:hypothetical protein